MRSLYIITLLTVFLFGCHERESEKENSRPVPDPCGRTRGYSGASHSSAQASPANSINTKQRRTKRKSTPPLPEVPGTASFSRAPDTLLVERLRFLRALQVETDLNEPVSRDYLFSQTENSAFPSVIELSRERYFKLQFDNDILDNTDRFYTNGILLQYICPAFSSSPLSKLMVPYWRPGINYYGMSLVQNMYTSSKTKVGGILYGDRPYAAYLYLSAFKITNDPVHRMRQVSELQLGVIGPASLGGVVQTWFHQAVPSNDKPQGWEYQINNDLLLNYLVAYEKGLVSKRNLELNLTGYGILGTVHTEVNAGFYFRAGLFNPYFKTLGFSKRSVNRANGTRNTQAFAFLKATGTACGYDATLQGGLFNRDNAYTLPADSISRFQFNGSAGVAVSWGAARLDIEQHLISPEFTGGLWHLWIGVGLTFSF